MDNMKSGNIKVWRFLHLTLLYVNIKEKLWTNFLKMQDEYVVLRGLEIVNSGCLGIRNVNPLDTEISGF